MGGASHLATLSLTWKEMFLSRWSGTDSRFSRSLSVTRAGRGRTCAVVEARVGHECRRASSRTTEARTASSTVFLRERILLTAAETQQQCEHRQGQDSSLN